MPAPNEQHTQPAPAPWQRATPNALTCARIVMAGVVVALLSWPEPRPGMLLAAAAVFALAAITDALDGYLARRWNAISRFGRIMDPLADKILVLGTFVALAGPAMAWQTDAGTAYQASGVAPWMAVVILARELLVTSIRGVYEGEGVDFSAGLSGKLKMIAQSLAAPAILVLVALADVEPGTPARAAVLALAWATVIITAVSAVPYITRAARAERQLAARP